MSTHDLPLAQRIEKAGQAYRASKTAYDDDREKLFEAIDAGLAADMGPSEIARYSGFTREYIARIRDGKVKRRD